MKVDSNDKNPYDDIINLEHHVSSTRAHMSIHDRAAQFSPFAALTGYDGAIKEAARLTNQKIELDETAKTILDEKLRIVQNQLSGLKELELVYFQPDEMKSGGEYITKVGTIRKIDTYKRTVVMQDGTRVPIDEIADITGEIFQAVNDFYA